MDEMNAPRYWFKSNQMRDTVNECMEIMQKNGLTYDQADMLPACLKNAIDSSRTVALDKLTFEPAPVSFGSDGMGGYAISPYPLAD